MSLELAKYFDVVQFNSFRRIPSCDIILIIKQRPPEHLIATLRQNGVKLVFAPIDCYDAHADIHRDAMLLGSCHLVIAHSEPLLRALRPYCSRVVLMEHHGKYTLPHLTSYKREGFVLWIGGLQHVPYLLDWLNRHPLQREVKILTDLKNGNAVSAARNLSRRLRVRIDIGRNSVNGYHAVEWSEGEQLRMMQDCKAAIDIKGGDFNQLTKPPTKAQQFVSSGIAFACNAETSATKYFRERGFELASPLAQERWFSFEYWQETRSFAADLRERLAIEPVGLSYRTELRSLLDNRDPETETPRVA